MLKYCILLILFSYQINAQQNILFKKNSEFGFITEIKNTEDNKLLLLINENSIDTIIPIVKEKIMDVYLQNNVCFVLTSPGLYIKKYIKTDKWTYCFSKYLINNFDNNIFVQNAFFLNDNKDLLFVKNKEFGEDRAFILKKIDNIYHQIYFSHTFLYFQKSTVRDSIFEKYKQDFYIKKIVGDYDLGEYLRDSTLFTEYLNQPTHRGLLVRNYFTDVIFEAMLNEKGFTFPNKDFSIQDIEIPQIVADSTGVYIKLTSHKRILRVITEKKDSLIKIEDTPLQVKIAEPINKGSVSWSFIANDLLSITFPDSTQKIYYIDAKNNFYNPKIMVLKSIYPRAFHTTIDLQKITIPDECTTKTEK